MRGICYNSGERGDDVNLEKREHRRNSALRLTIAALGVLVQIAWFLYLVLSLNRYSPVANLLFSLFAVVAALRIFGREENAAFKLSWIIFILGFPILGLSFYFLFGNKRLPRKIRRRLEAYDAAAKPYLAQEPTVLDSLAASEPHIGSVCRYLAEVGGYPLYRDTEVTYYGDAAEAFEAQLADLAEARHYIFMEYHAIEDAIAFERLAAVLAGRVAAGVEVRMFYDDIGSWSFIDRSFITRMEKLGVVCRAFNPVYPILNLFMNNRDHRKITVIDGTIGYTGGYNLADEYFNITHPYGHWKDSGIRLAGDAVRSLAIQFLELWSAMDGVTPPLERFLPASEESLLIHGAFVQPYADRPMDDIPLSENVYLNLIKTATRRLYITTPYLIIDDEMRRELILAAGRGVDVRIITPGVPDKKLIRRVTRSHYGPLVRGGVQIWEYTPGFLHAKQMLVDDDTATVGTVNLDYRSLYHHFENGVLFHGGAAPRMVADDFEALFSVSENVTEKYRKYRRRTLGQCILQLLIPLL